MRHYEGSVLGPSGSRLPFSAAVQVGPVLYLSGQIALVDGRIAGDDIVAQTRAVFDNVSSALRVAGLDLTDVFKVTIWLVDGDDFVAFNEVYASMFSPPYPVRSTVVSKLAMPGALVEMEVVARVRE